MRLRLTYTILSLAACASADPIAKDIDEPAEPGPEIIYCDGAAACPADPPCAVWWCHQIQQDDPEFGAAWGTCRLDPSPDGTPCADGAGVCDNRTCSVSR
jgi:hypothetical protein